MQLNALKRITSALMLAAASSMASANFVSSFFDDDEGWRVDSSQSTEGVADFAWSASGGNPGGHLHARDIGAQGGWWFLAPPTWSGDWSVYLGGTIRFDVFSIAGQDTRLNPPVEAVVLALEDGGRLRARFGAGAVLDQWTSIEVPIESKFFSLTNSNYGSFAEALAHVTRLIIPGDFVYRQEDVTRIDNVTVSAVPAPGTLPLLLAGAAALIGASLHSTKPGRSTFA
jgi:hypothetical protein